MKVIFTTISKTTGQQVFFDGYGFSLLRKNAQVMIAADESIVQKKHGRLEREYKQPIHVIPIGLGNG